MHAFVIVCLIVAASCFTAETIGIPTRINLIALGLLAFVLSVLVPIL